MGARFNKAASTRIRLTENFSFSMAEAFMVILLGAFALFSRISLFPYASGDYGQFLSHWFDTLQAAGGLPGIGLSLGDYTPPYVYILSLLTYLPIYSLYSIKLVSVLFDFVLAIAVMRTVYLSGRNKTAAIGAYAAVLFAPTVLLNSAFWAQCDGLYTAFLILSLCAYLREKPLAGTIYFSIAFCFKLQAIFFAPLLVFLWLKDRIKLRHFLVIPGIYLLSILPAWIAGRPIGELLTIYAAQSGQYSGISLNAPNLYIFIEGNTDRALSTSAIFLCGGLVLLFLYLLYRQNTPVTKESILRVALFFALLLPYFLPHMHERYFYLADILAILYAFYRPRRFYLPVLVVGASLAAYIPFLFGGEPFSLRLASILMLLALLQVGVDLFGGSHRSGQEAIGKQGQD